MNSSFALLYMQSCKSSTSNFTWKQQLHPVEQFTVPNLVKGVLQGWEKKRKQQEDQRHSQPYIESAEKGISEGEFEGRPEGQEEYKLQYQSSTVKSGNEAGQQHPNLSVAPRIDEEGHKMQHKHPLVPLLPLSHPVKSAKQTRVLPPRKPKKLRELVRSKSKSFVLSEIPPVSLPKVIEEFPPPKPLSKRKMAEPHLLKSINEYNDRKAKGDTHITALSQTTKHARDIIRDPRRLDLDLELFSTEQMLSFSTVSKDKELEEKMNRLFASISAKTKMNGKLKTKAEAGPDRVRSREAASNPSL
jgi:hypothetical protein